MDVFPSGGYYDLPSNKVGMGPCALQATEGNLFLSPGLNLQDVDDFWVVQHPLDSWTIPLWRATQWLERAESKRKRQVNFLEDKVEHLQNKLAESQAGGNVGEQVSKTNDAHVVIAEEVEKLIAQLSMKDIECKNFETQVTEVRNLLVEKEARLQDALDSQQDNPLKLNAAVLFFEASQMSHMRGRNLYRESASRFNGHRCRKRSSSPSFDWDVHLDISQEARLQDALDSQQMASPRPSPPVLFSLSPQRHGDTDGRSVIKMPTLLESPPVVKNPFLDEEDTTPDASSSRKCWATCPESPKNPFLDEEDTTPDVSSSRKSWATCPESPCDWGETATSFPDGSPMTETGSGPEAGECRWRWAACGLPKEEVESFLGQNPPIEDVRKLLELLKARDA